MRRGVLLVVGHSAGGIGAHVASLASGFAQRGWTATVATSGATGGRFDFGGAEVLGLWPRRGASPLGRLRRIWRLRSRLARADVVHAHGHQAGLLAVLLAATLHRRRRPPVVVSWHNAVLGSGPGRAARGLLERLQARRADLVTGASEDLVERARALGARAARLAPVAAPAAGTWQGDRHEARSSLARELGLREDVPWVLTVSRIAPQKRLGDLVAAAALLRDRADLVWVVVGEGDADLLRRLDADVARTGAPVRFVGPRRDVVVLMAVADLFVLTSAWEARALVVQEAMAAGLPVVATAVGGLPELVGDAGLLVPPEDPQALADAVSRLLADGGHRERLGATGRARFAQLPGEDDVVDAWTGEYERLLRRGW